jgi:DNA-binding NtrC family response regulator
MNDIKSTTFHNWNVLVVDDDENVLTSYRIALSSLGIGNVQCCQDSRKAIDMLAEKKVDLILLDLMMPHKSGEELLEEIHEGHPAIPIIITTGVNEVKTAVRCMRKGAFDYLIKPVDIDRLEHSIWRALDVRTLREVNESLSNQLLSGKLDYPESFERIITRNKVMFSIFQYCEAIGKSHFPVLVTGETGVGKELLAKAIHDVSNREGKFIAVNMAGLDDHLINDTLFGHVKGGFTGANADRKGLIEKASGGSIFLDEIGDLNLQSQVKLLRVLQEREYYPIGSDSPKTTDARVIVATHADLNEMQQEGDFRQDLFYRLRMHHIHMPPLRERREDLQLLFEYFLREASQDLSKKTPHYPQQLLTLLELHTFPGNIRELQSIVYEAVSKHSSKTMSTQVFRERIQKQGSIQAREENGYDKHTWVTALNELPTLKESSLSLIKEAMHRAGNNQRVAAVMLGISHQALNKRLKRTNMMGNGD